MNWPDRLLDWSSEREAGTFGAFRGTYEWLTGQDPAAAPWARVLRNLQALDHLEVDWPARTWRSLPPRLVPLLDSGGHALLTGGRPRWLLDRLDTLDRDPDPRVRALAPDVLLCPPVPQQEAPSARYLAVGSTHALRRVAALLSLDWQPNLADALATTLPRLSDLLLRGERQAPVGLPAQRMGDHPSGSLFRPAEDTGQPGAYAYPGYAGDRYFFRLDRTHSYEAEKATVVYAELRRQRRYVLYHETRRRELFIPARMRLPAPYARGAIARTGLLADYQQTVEVGARRLGSVLRYQNVTAEFAERLGDCLGQKVQVLE